MLLYDAYACTYAKKYSKINSFLRTDRNKLSLEPYGNIFSSMTWNLKMVIFLCEL